MNGLKKIDQRLLQALRRAEIQNNETAQRALSALVVAWLEHGVDEAENQLTTTLSVVKRVKQLWDMNKIRRNPYSKDEFIGDVTTELWPMIENSELGEQLTPQSLRLLIENTIN